MIESSKPRLLKGPLKGDEWHALIQCPECFREAWIDRDQFEGRVSIVCECGWHETHNLVGVRVMEGWPGGHYD